MQVMILDEDPGLRTQIAAALAPEGFDIMSFGRIGPAKDAARRAIVDVLILGEAVEGRLVHDVALLAEWRNPSLGAILLSDRQGEDLDELFELIPSLQAVLGRRTEARTLVQVALSAAHSRNTDKARTSVWDDEAEDLHDALVTTTGVSGLAETLGDVEASLGEIVEASHGEKGAVMAFLMPSAAIDPVQSVTATPVKAAGETTADQVLSLPIPEGPASDPVPSTNPSSTVLSVDETRKLLSELAKRYAVMTEKPAQLQAASLAPRSHPATTTPLAMQSASPPKPAPVVEPAPQILPQSAPARAAAGGRRLHLA